MLCSYWYREGEKEFGGDKGYFCETDDFKKFFKNRIKFLDDVVVELKNGDKWIFYKIKKLNVGIWEKICNKEKNCIKKVVINL